MNFSAARSIGLVEATQKRFMSSDAVTIKVGQRSNVSGVVCTVYGSTGNLGPLVCDRLGSMGCMLVLPYRDDGLRVRINKVSGDPGQIAPVPIDYFDANSVVRASSRSNIAINMVGSLRSTRHYSVHDSNVKTAHRIAKAAKEAGVERFIHVSALGAKKDADSEVLRTKYEAEEAVKYFFPQATIIRPAPMYAIDTKYLQEILMNIGDYKSDHTVPFGDAVFQPVSLKDVAVAIQQIVAHPEIDGQTWEFVGERVTTRREIGQMAEGYIQRGINITYEDKLTSQAKALAADFMLKFVSNQSLYNASSEAYDYWYSNLTKSGGTYKKGLEDLGITPSNFAMAVLQASRPFLKENSPANMGYEKSIFTWRPN